MKRFLLVALMLVSFASCREAIENNNNPITPVNEPPYVPTNPIPLDNATNVSRFITLEWIGGDPNASDTVRYDIFMGTTNPPINLVLEGTLLTRIDVGLGAANTTYYWKVIARDNNSTYSESSIWKFRTSN